MPSTSEVLEVSEVEDAVKMMAFSHSKEPVSTLPAAVQLLEEAAVALPMSRSVVRVPHH